MVFSGICVEKKYNTFRSYSLKTEYTETFHLIVFHGH